MSVSAAGGGGVRPVRVEFDATDNITPKTKSMDAALDELRSRFSSTATSAGQSIDKLAQQNEQSAGKMTSAWKKFGENFKKDFTLVLQGAQQGFAQIGQGIENLAERSSQLTTVGQAFESLGKKASGGTDELLANLKRASGGTLDNLQAMKQANLGLLLMGQDVADKLPKLFEIAKAAAKATGESVEFMTDSMIRGLARQSPRILDNLGLTVNLEQAHAEYAAALGKSADALSEAEQQQALLNKVLEFGDGLIANVGGRVKTMGQEVKSTQAFIRDMGDSFLQTATHGSEAMGTMLGSVAAVAGELSNMSGLLLSVNSLFQLGGPVALAWAAAGTLAVSGFLTVAKELNDGFADLPRLLDEAAKSAGLNFPKMSAAARDARDEVRGWMELTIDSIPGVNALLQAQRGLKGGMQVIAPVISEAADSLAAYNQHMHATGALSPFAAVGIQQITSSARPLVGLFDPFSKLFNVIRGGLASFKEFGSAGMWIEKFSDKLKEQAKAAKDHVKDVSDAQKQLVRNMQDAFVAEQQEVDRFNKKWVQDDLENLRDESKELGETLQSWFDLWNVGWGHAAVSIVDWSKSSIGAIDAYDARLKQLMETGEAGSGLGEFKLSDFHLTPFGQNARAREEARREMGRRPTPGGSVQSLIDPGSRMVGAETPGDIQVMVMQYEALQQRIQEVQKELEIQPRSVAELKKSFAELHPELFKSTEALVGSTGALIQNTDTIKGLQQPLTDAKDQLILTGASANSSAGSFNALGVAIEPIPHDMGLITTQTGLYKVTLEGPAGAVALTNNLKAAFDSVKGAIPALNTNLDLLKKKFTDPLPNGLNPVIQESANRLVYGANSLNGALDILREKIQLFNTEQRVIDFKATLTGFGTSTQTAATALSSTLPIALANLPGAFQTFNSNSNVTAFSGTMNTLGGSADTLGTKLTTLTGNNGPLDLFASKLGTIKTTANDIVTAFNTLSTNQTGAVDLLKNKFSGFRNSTEVADLKSGLDDIKAKLKDMGDVNIQGSFPWLGSASDTFKNKLGPSTDGNTLAYRLDQLIPTDTTGPLGKTKVAFSSWATAVGTLSSDMGILASNVSALTTNLNAQIASRSTANDQLTYLSRAPDQWERILTQLSPTINGLGSRNEFRATWGNNYVGAARDLMDFFFVPHNRTYLKGGSSGRVSAAEPAMAMSGARGGGDTHIHVHIPAGSLPTTRREAKLLASAVIGELGQRLGAQPHIGRLARKR